MPLFSDPTPRVERKDSLCTVVSVGAESTTHTGKTGVVSWKGRNYGATIIGSVAAGDKAHFIQTADGHVWAIKAGSYYRSAYPKRPEEWSKKAPASLAILELMKKNPRDRVFQTGKIKAIGTNTATVNLMGKDVSLPTGFEFLLMQAAGSLAGRYCLVFDSRQVLSPTPTADFDGISDFVGLESYNGTQARYLEHRYRTSKMLFYPATDPSHNYELDMWVVTIPKPNLNSVYYATALPIAYCSSKYGFFSPTDTKIRLSEGSVIEIMVPSSESFRTLGTITYTNKDRVLKDSAEVECSINVGEKTNSQIPTGVLSFVMPKTMVIDGTEAGRLDLLAPELQNVFALATTKWLGGPFYFYSSCYFDGFDDVPEAWINALARFNFEVI